MALVWAAALLLVVAGIVVSGTTDLEALREGEATRFAAQIHAHAVARAGLAAGHGWFRRQSNQPVPAFTPRRDLLADPSVNETDDPTLGLVREYEVSPGLWARFEVPLGTPGEPYADADANGRYDDGEPFTDLDGDGRWSPPSGTRDVSALRGGNAGGTTWLLVSRGMLFARPRRDLPLGTTPNDLVASEWLAKEISRLAVVPPGAAAICIRDGRALDLGRRSRVRSPSLAVATGGGVVSAHPQAEIQAPTLDAVTPGYDDSLLAVFGQGWEALATLADLATSAPALELPGPVANGALYVVHGNVVYDDAKPLTGSGILVVRGNLTFAAGSGSYFNGLIYVDGDVTVNAPAFLRGSVVCRGSMRVSGSHGDFAEIEYDSFVLDSVFRSVSGYRSSTSHYPVGAGGSP
jgi:hypothetical protein